MSRLTFLDALRGVALVLMVLNHTSRDWMDGGVMGWGRYYLIYATLLFPAPLFLFLVGFCLPLAPPGSPVAYLRRGLVIVGAGYLLNVLVQPEQPWWSGGVLQTIGLAIMFLGPALPLLHRRWARGALVALATSGYFAFAASVPVLAAWSTSHPIAGRALFNDFAPWPWLSVAIIGLVLGRTWLEARARDRDAETRFFTYVAAVGMLVAIACVAGEWWTATRLPFGFRRDLVLNNHWTPRAATALVIIAGVATLLAGAYRLMELGHRQLTWLVILGRTALMLYVVHQLIESTLVQKALGLRFNDWWLYLVANAMFLVVLVYLGRAWLGIKAWHASRRA